VFVQKIWNSIAKKLEGITIQKADAKVQAMFDSTLK